MDSEFYTRFGNHVISLGLYSCNDYLNIKSNSNAVFSFIKANIQTQCSITFKSIPRSFFFSKYLNAYSNVLRLKEKRYVVCFLLIDLVRVRKCSDNNALFTSKYFEFDIC